jgi:hypothetical protein
MTTIMPEGEPIKKAVAWISEQRQARPDKNPRKIADEAILKFDLSPTEAEFLSKFVSGKAGS